MSLRPHLSAAVLAAVAALGAPLASQPGLQQVVPHGFARVDAPGLAFWALTPFESRHQLLIDAAQLPRGPRGAIDGIRVRRNAAANEDAIGGRLAVTLDIGFTSRPALLASPVFAANRGAGLQRVFDATIDLPSRPALTGGIPAFDGADGLTIPFNVPVALPRQGALCIETTTRPFVDPVTGRTDAPWWPLDAWTQRIEATVASRGTSCLDGLGDAPAGVDASSLRVGETAVFHLRGPGGPRFPVFGLGLPDLPGGFGLPLDLGAFGAPGCAVQILPLSTASTLMSGLPGGRHRALAIATVDLPTAPTLLGGRLGAQWFELDPNANRLGLTASNGVVGTIAHAPPSGFAWIESTDATASHGRLIRDRIPVLQLRTP